MVQPQPKTQVVVRKTGEILEAPLVTLSEVSIANIAHNVAMSEKLVTTLLEKDIDYGRTPGTQSDGLWDAGAAKIMAGFNCYVDHQVLFHTDEDKLISWCIQANIISRETQTIVGTGVGAASTKETKYKYRWVEDPQNYGYGDDEIAKMKKRDGGRKFRIENPEYGELVNTLFLMAAKRAEVDGARSMPGVGGALKKLFTNKIKSQPGAPARKENKWTPFWGMVQKMGLTQDEARKYLEVEHMEDWITEGGTVETARTTLAARVAASKTGQPAQRREAKDIPERAEGEFKNTQDLLRICHEDFNMQPVDVFKELGYPNQGVYEEAGVDKPFQSYLAIKAVRITTDVLKEQPEEKEELPF